MAFKYRERAPESVDKRAEQKGAGDFDGFIDEQFKMYSVAKGDNWIRILPPTWEDPEHYGMDVWVHYGIGSDRASVVCPAKQPHPETGEKGRCPICEAAAKADRLGDEELAKELRPTRRVLVWLLNQREPEKGPLLWAMPWTVDRDIAKISKDKRTGAHYVIDHPDEGFDVTFEKEGDQRTTKYTGFQLSRRASSVDTEHLDFVEGAPIPYTLKWRDYDELTKLFNASGMGDSDRPRERATADRAGPTNGHDRDPPPRDREREPEKPASRERFRPPPREEAREPARESPRESPREREPEREPARDRSRDYPDDREREANTKRNADIDDTLPEEKPKRPAYEERGGSSSAADKAAALRAKFAKK